MVQPSKPLPELLMPAGSLEKAEIAFRYGADAVYCGVPMFSLRTRENNVTEDDLRTIITMGHEHDKKVYVTVNGFPHQFAIELLKKHLQFLHEVKPDGIIFADMGVLSLANDIIPDVPKHLSVQTSTMNVPAMKLWQKLGVCRVICAREMSIREVAQIHKLMPEMELEYFVHGSVCMAYSGRCLLSNFTGGRDANRGTCNHTCRWNYRLVDEDGHVLDMSDHLGCEGCPAAEVSSLRDWEKIGHVEEEQRQGQIVDIEEDFHGSHIMSSRDMCMIEHLESIMEAGVCSLKVEGRNKTPYYVATIARAYREALDNLRDGKAFDSSLWDEVHATANRGFFPGFVNGKPQSGDIQYEANRSTSSQEFCAQVTGWHDCRAEILVKNRINEGTELEFVLPRRADDFVVKAEDMQFGDTAVTELHGGNTNEVASLACEREVPIGTFIRQMTQNPSQQKEHK